MPKLIKSEKKKTVFVGDTHGDLEATKQVMNKYLNAHQIVFLGDYVDRGDKSKKNIDYLLKMKQKYPDKIHLLQGNHEGYKYRKSSPASFWDSLERKEKEKYKDKLAKLPLVFSMGNIIALHGALPDIDDLSEVENIEPKDENWYSVIWGDFRPAEAEKIGSDMMTGRPQFGRK